MECMKCQAKDTIATTTTYFVQLENCYVIIEHVPCMQCEECGEKFFKMSVMEKIEMILDTLENKGESILVMDYNSAA